MSSVGVWSPLEQGFCLPEPAGSGSPGLGSLKPPRGRSLLGRLLEGPCAALGCAPAWEAGGE